MKIFFWRKNLAKYLHAGITGCHGFHIERGSDYISVGPKTLLGAPGTIAFPCVCPDTELVFRVVIKIGKNSLLVGGLAQLLLVWVCAFPELDFVLGDLPISGVFRWGVVDNLHNIRSLEAPGNILGGISGQAFRSEVKLYGLLAWTNIVDSCNSELIFYPLFQARNLLGIKIID